MRWTEPVRPGDTIFRTEIEVVGVRYSRKRKDYGVVTTTTKAINQREQVVMRATVNFLARSASLPPDNRFLHLGTSNLF